MKKYRLYHRVLREFRNVDADAAQAACEKVGWMIGDVWVREYTPTVEDPGSESGHKYGGWKFITPRTLRLSL